MKLFVDFDIKKFKAWSGGEDTKANIINAGKADLFNALVDDIFPEGCTETTMNDFLWFDSASIYEMLGLNEDGEEPGEEKEVDPACFDTFSDFCDGRKCSGCPLNEKCGTRTDCEELFDELKGV